MKPDSIPVKRNVDQLVPETVRSEAEGMAAVAQPLSDTAKYAEGLRASLIADLFDGADDVDLEDDDADKLAGEETFTVEDYIGTSGADALQDVEADLESFADNDIIKGECDL